MPRADDDDGPTLLRRATQYNDVLDNDSSDWQDMLAAFQEKLSKLPLLALLLPSKHDVKASETFQRLSPQGIKVVVAAHTSYLHRPRTLWVLDWQNSEAKTPALHLSNFVGLISEQIEDLCGPGTWIWPLNDGEVCSAISLSELSDSKAKWWRKILWAIRLMPPENGSIQEKCVLDHYGRETGYVFAWANLFTRGLWIMALPSLIFGIANVRPSNVGVDSLAWYLLQLLTILWGLGMVIFGSSRQVVLRSGTGLKKVLVKKEVELKARTQIFESVPPPSENQEAPSEEPQAAAKDMQSFPLPNQIADVDKKAFIEDSKPTSTEAEKSEGQVGADTKETHEHPEQQKEKKSNRHQSRKVMKGLKQLRPEENVSSQKVAELLASDKKDDKASNINDRQLNPEYVREKSSAGRYVMASFLTLGILTLFLSFSALVLSLLLQLKSFLIFEWGECIRLGCDNAGQKWGFTATLVDIAVDILLALVFVVGLGESCKALSFHLARFWNFRLMRRRHTFQSLTSICIEVMAKVGLFALLAFIFLPSWTAESINGSSELPEVICSDLVDYKICKAMGCQNSQDPYCCSGTLGCASRLLPFSARRALFENWLVGPFVVAPFVDLIPAVLAPLLADHLADLADEGAKSRCGRCCCACCGWLARFLAFIFVLDGGVTGIRYVCLGNTFRQTQQFQVESGGAEVEDQEQTEVMEDALEQLVLREHDAIDEIKELKLNFLFVLLFAPLKPLLVLPTLLARIIEVRAKLQKLFWVKRRNVPRDARLVHAPQELFTVFALTVACFWHLGLALMAYNDQLPFWDSGILVGAWVGGSVVLSTLTILIYRQADKRSWALLAV